MLCCARRVFALMRGTTHQHTTSPESQPIRDRAPRGHAGEPPDRPFRTGFRGRSDPRSVRVSRATNKREVAGPGRVDGRGRRAGRQGRRTGAMDDWPTGRTVGCLTKTGRLEASTMRGASPLSFSHATSLGESCSHRPRVRAGSIPGCRARTNDSAVERLNRPVVPWPIPPKRPDRVVGSPREVDGVPARTAGAAWRRARIRGARLGHRRSAVRAGAPDPARRRSRRGGHPADSRQHLA